MDAPAGVYCRECEPGVGCKIYVSRPGKCRGFVCLYAQVDSCAEELRPDRCGVILEKVQDTFILATPDAGFKLSPVLEGQISAFVAEGYSVVLNMKPRKQVWLAQGHTQEGLQSVWREANGDLRN
jgi:hypothetical protein